MTDLIPPVPKPASRARVVAAGIVGIFVGALAFAAVTRLTAPGPAPATEVPAKPRPPAPLEPQSPATLEERAAKGDKQAVAELERLAPKDRTSEQVLALAGARAALKQAEIEELRRKITLVPDVGRQPDVQKRVKELAEDPEASTAMLRMLVALPNEVGPDLLYGLSTARERSETSSLAEELVYSSNVRKHASPALSVALDLRAAEQCEAVLKTLERAQEHGDRRSLVMLNRFFNKRGCGAKKRDDCWACLRDSDLLKRATAAVRTRRAS